MIPSASTVFKQLQVERRRMSRSARQEVAGLDRAHDLVHAAVVVAMVMADRHQVERLDSLAPEHAQGGVLGRTGVDQGRLALGRPDQDRVALADVEDLDRDRAWRLDRPNKLRLSSARERPAMRGPPETAQNARDIAYESSQLDISTRIALRQLVLDLAGFIGELFGLRRRRARA